MQNQNQIRSKAVLFRVSPEEKQEIEDLAGKHRTSVSELIRYSLRRLNAVSKPEGDRR